MNSLQDISCKDMVKCFSRCKDHYPISDRYINEIHDSPDKTGRTEKEHMISWFRANQTKGSGSYVRQKGNKSAKTCYNHLNNAASLLWIAEAVGISSDVIEQAYSSAVASGDYRRACGAIRKIIPWEIIAAAFSKL